jgi:hypothetical protein
MREVRWFSVGERGVYAGMRLRKRRLKLWAIGAVPISLRHVGMPGSLRADPIVVGDPIHVSVFRHWCA